MIGHKTMAETLRQDIDFNSLFKKLGHHLDEIRVRALENILSKLEHKLICDSDLVQERHLFIRLLEWFNFPKSSRHSDVLNLFLRLSQHTSAAETIQDIGGIEFLTLLRKDVASSLQPLVDQILENCMRLPDVDVGLDHAPECIYQRHDHTGAGETTVETMATRLTQDCSLDPSSRHAPSEVGLKLPNYREPPLGFFQGDAQVSTNQLPPTDLPVHVNVGTDCSSCFRMTIFPWLPLTPTDRHVISSTNSSLQSREGAMLVSTCEFLSDVVFQDFPAEIFLQRPNIIKNLISLLSGPLRDQGAPRLAAIHTLGDYMACLRSKIRCHQDPNLYTVKQDFSTTPSPFSTPSSSSSANQNAGDGRPSVIGWTDPRPRGDGRDGDTSASSTGTSRASSVGLSPVDGLDPGIDLEDTPSLQYMQVTLPQLCALVLQKALPLLGTPDEALTNEVFYLLNLTLDIVAVVVTPDLWQDQSMAARECSEKFIESLDMIADLLKSHHHGNAPYDPESSPDQGPEDLVQHRLCVLGLHVLLCRFLKTLVPVNMSQGIVSERLLSMMNILVYDESLSNTFPDLQLLLLGYLQQLDVGRFNVYVSTATICQSLQKTCKFMTLAQEEASRLSKDTLSLCEGAFDSLPYHRHMAYVTETVRLCSDICARSQHYETQKSHYRKLVLQLLSHPIDKIRLCGYSNVLQVVKSSLSVMKACEPGSTSSEKAKFLLNSDILYEIVQFGLADKDDQVSGVASDLVTHLLKSQLLMPADMWQRFMKELMRGLPILQSYASLNTVLGTSILSMLDTTSSSRPGELTRTDKLRGTLRCMLSADIKVRSEALKRLSWYLSTEDGSSRKLPTFSELDVSHLSNLLIVDTPRSVDEDLGRSVFQVDGLRKVYEIFTTLSADPSVKKSAADQLAIILQDPSLHGAFKKDGGVEKILEHIQLGTMKDGDSNMNSTMQYLPACMTILRHLVHNDYTLRHKLAHDASLYLTLFRVGLLFSRDDRTCYEVSHLLTLLLFDEQARFHVSGSKNSTFSVPHILKIRYKLPFRPATQPDTSPHAPLAPMDPDPLVTGEPLEMMRVTWNVAWNAGMDTLVEGLGKARQGSDSDLEFSAKLRLTPTDKIILKTSHLKQGLQSAIHDITNSTSHYAVQRSLRRLLSYLVVRGDAEVMNVFHTLDWCGALARFVKVTPSSIADENLLLDILRFNSLVLRLTNHAPDNILQWIGEILYHPKGPLIGLLHRQTAREVPDEGSDNLVSVKRSLDKALLAFISEYNSSLPYQLTVRLKFHQLRGDLVHRLIQRLNVTEAPHFYNLASLEGTLLCLMHITARPGWSTECTDQDGLALRRNVLGCLLEVVSAFHVGRGGTSMSFMGKGVTKAATLCLRNLSYEMATLADDKTWTKSWLYSRHSGGLSSESGLDWMLTLWAYRDAEVRTAGLGIAVTLSCVEEGRLLLTTNCKHIPGGIWAAAFSLLLDQSECSMVRQQAALLLVNLTSTPLPSGSTETDHGTWHGPVVMDTEYQVSLTGLTALLALLHHCQFYREMTLLLSSYYTQPTIQPSVTSELYQLSASTSENTLSVLADAGLVPRPGSASHLNTMSLLQSSGVSSLRGLERPGVIGSANPSAGNQTPGSSNATSPTTSRQQDTRQGGNSRTVAGRETTPDQNVTTPCLVSAVSQLVRNLMIQAPQNTVTALKNESLVPFFVSMLDAGFLEGIQVLTGSPQLELFFTELVEMHISILRLLQTSLVHDPTMRMEILQDHVALGGVVSLFRIHSKVSEDTRATCSELWEAVLSFLTTLLQMQGGPAVEVLAIVLSKQWEPITDCIQRILDGEFASRTLYVMCVDFLCVLCAEEGKLQARLGNEKQGRESLTKLLNLPRGSDTENTESGQVTGGSSFCKSLIASCDQFILRKQESSHSGERIHVISALKCLLAISQSAKAKALELGLVENLMEHVKQTHSKLNLTSLQTNKQGSKVKDEPAVQELILTFDLLRNFMYRNDDVKMACYHCGLHSLLHRLWSWCQLDTGLMACAVALLTTYTASCPAATSSLAYTSLGVTQGLPQGKSGLSPNSLVHCVIKHTCKEGLKEPMVKSLFGLLANLALSAECRNIIWKSNFLQDFSNLNPKRSKAFKSKGKQYLTETLWLELLLNLSFSLEGQQMILKIPGTVTIN
ncbi:rotatin-like isoform X2 [Dreissena polymorpha]|uniref:rotatin-like isoform X2 n=1 Tax=Dreissena polymorpha TaxID=45954 RepID=UPI002264ADEB|nr:rotatin-like isoform X2 [Dreissena polymorpha]